MKYPIIIVGGGVIGLLCARELVQAGEKVVILDRGPAGKESSWAGGGILSPLYPWRYTDAITELARWSQSAYPGIVKDLQQETGIDSEWVRSGLLVFDVSNVGIALDWAAKFAISMKHPNSSEIDNIQSGLARSGGESVWMPDIAQVRNPRLLAALKRYLEKQGVEFLENEVVKELVVNNDKITAIKTISRTLTTDRCIITAGAWSQGLCNQLGFHIDIKPVRGQMLLFAPRPGLLHRIILKNNRYLIPRRDGRILIGSTIEDTGFDKSTTEEAARELYQAAVQMLPALAGTDVEMQWAGLRPGSPQGIPYIGPCPQVSGLFVCTGHYRNGFVLGPASARIIADLVLERESELNPDPFLLAGRLKLVNH